MEECDGVYVPPSLEKHSLVYFATDNCDFENDTPDGKYKFHGTVQIVYQNAVTPISHQPIEINRNQNKTLNLNPSPQTETIPKPKPPNKSYQAFNNSFHDIERYKNIDTLWFTMKYFNNDNPIPSTPTWAAYNSLISKALPITTTCALPLYPAPPDDYSNLYQALNICQNISTKVAPDNKTIISLGLQLYAN